MWISGTKFLWTITYANPKIVSSTSGKPHYFLNNPTSTSIKDDKLNPTHAYPAWLDPTLMGRVLPTRETIGLGLGWVRVDRKSVV